MEGYRVAAAETNRQGHESDGDSADEAAYLAAAVAQQEYNEAEEKREHTTAMAATPCSNMSGGSDRDSWFCRTDLLNNQTLVSVLDACFTCYRDSAPLLQCRERTSGGSSGAARLTCGA